MYKFAKPSTPLVGYIIDNNNIIIIIFITVINYLEHNCFSPTAVCQKFVDYQLVEFVFYFKMYHIITLLRHLLQSMEGNIRICSTQCVKVDSCF